MRPVHFVSRLGSVRLSGGPRVASTRRRITALALLLSVLAGATEVVRNEGALRSDRPPVQLAAGALPDASQDAGHGDCACLCACSCDLAQVAVVVQAMTAEPPALESFFRPVSPPTSAARGVASPVFRPPVA